MLASVVATVALAMPPAWVERWTSFHTWSRSSLPVTSDKVAHMWLSPPIESKGAWNDLVLSWSANLGPDSTLEVAVRTLSDTQASPFFSFGTWSTVNQAFGQTQGARSSLNGQTFEQGEVFTDTLLLKEPAKRFEVRLVVVSPVGSKPEFRTLSASFRHSKNEPLSRSENKGAWGKILDVPQLCQGDYDNGGVICSPTSTTMLLQYWASKAQKPEWGKSVPETVAGVYDIAWKGTGNWIFNTAYAASLGLQAEVLRLNDLRDLEDLVDTGFPVACSVSYDLLKGKGAKGANDGHIVVLVGFDPQGNPVFNDPGRRDVRQIYQRAHFEAAWKTSDRTVYLIHAPSAMPPKLSVDLP